MATKVSPYHQDKKFAGLTEINDFDVIKPRDHWCDKGAAFTGKLMSKFKCFKAACSLIRAQKKEHHQIIEYTSQSIRGWLDPSGFSRFDDTGTLSHLLMLLLAKFEEERKIEGEICPWMIPERTCRRREQKRRDGPPSARDNVRLQERRRSDGKLGL